MSIPITAATAWLILLILNIAIMALQIVCIGYSKKVLRLMEEFECSSNTPNELRDIADFMDNYAGKEE